MKIEGKVKELKKVLMKAGCGGAFDPVTFQLIDNGLACKMNEPSNIMAMMGKFRNLETDGKGEFTVDTELLLKHVKVLKNDDEFTIEKKKNKLVIKTDSETIHFRIQEDWDKRSMSADELPIKKTEDGFLIGEGEIELKTKVKMNASELGKILKRINIVDIDAVKFENEGKTLKTTIGDISSDEYDPHICKMNAEIEHDDDESVEIAYGMEEISSSVTGDIELHFSTNVPIIIFDKDEDYKVIYLVAPTIKKNE